MSMLPLSEFVEATRAYTIEEFRAWLDGFSTGFEGGLPNHEQYGEILNRLKRVTAPGVEWRYTPPFYTPPYAPPPLYLDYPGNPLYPQIWCGTARADGS